MKQLQKREPVQKQQPELAQRVAEMLARLPNQKPKAKQSRKVIKKKTAKAKQQQVDKIFYFHFFIYKNCMRLSSVFDPFRADVFQKKVDFKILLLDTE